MTWPKLTKNASFGPGHAGLFSALLVGRLVVVARGLYLARHLFTLYFYNMWSNILNDLNGSQGLIKPNKRLLLNTCGWYYRWTEEVPHPN